MAAILLSILGILNGNARTGAVLTLRLSAAVGSHICTVEAIGERYQSACSRVALGLVAWTSAGRVGARRALIDSRQDALAAGTDRSLTSGVGGDVGTRRAVGDVGSLTSGTRAQTLLARSTRLSASGLCILCVLDGNVCARAVLALWLSAPI